MRFSVKALFAAVPLIALSLGSVGCGPPWTIIRQGNPNPLTPQVQLAVDNTSFNGLMVGKKSEAEYLSEKKPETQQSFQNDKLAFMGGFTAGIQGQRGPLDIAGPDQAAGRFLVKSNVEFLEPGNFNGFVNIATEMRTKVMVTDPAGAPVDEIEIRCVVGADIYHPAVGMRVTECGRITGNYAARYFKQRTGVSK